MKRRLRLMQFWVARFSMANFVALKFVLLDRGTRTRDFTYSPASRTSSSFYTNKGSLTPPG